MHRTTRRGFLRGAGGGLLVVVAGGYGALGCENESVAPGWRLILSDPALCGACRRCAITCSSLRAGGPGAARGLADPDRYYQAMVFDSPAWHAATCHMCPELYDGETLSEPRCVAVCPSGAAQIAPAGHPVYGDSGVRFIDPDLCIRCGECVRECPWEHPLIEEHARKCDLCIGRYERPPCVDACPASALIYLDYYRESPPRPFPWMRST